MSLFGHNQQSSSDAPPSEPAADAAGTVGDVTLETLDASAASLSSFPGFDPSVHASNPDGTPKLRGDGTYQKKRGRKPGQKSAGGLIATTGATVDKISNEEAARQMCNAAITAAVGLIGPEWAPENKQESEGLVLAVKNYFDAKGQVDLPPEAGLVIAVVAYSGKRFMEHENTRQKVGRFVGEAWRKVKRAWGYLRVSAGTLV